MAGIVFACVLVLLSCSVLVSATSVETSFSATARTQDALQYLCEHLGYIKAAFEELGEKSF